MVAKLIHRLSDKSIEGMTGVCSVCGPVNLRWRSQGAGKKVVSCETARKNDRRNSRRSNDRYQRGSHGLTIDEARKFKAGKVCQICGGSERLAVDHCHVTGEIRGVLCGLCNRALGGFRDDPFLLFRAIQYLDPVGADISGRLGT
jgi:hypothetical protein